MNLTLPNYFLADLPEGATLTQTLIEDACRTLKRNRDSYLVQRTTSGIIRLLAGLAESWLEPQNRFRVMALHYGTRETGFSTATLAAGLDGYFKELTAENLQALVLQDIGHPQRLDIPCAVNTEQKTQRAAIATGPELIAHVTAGRIPNPVFMSIVLGLLTRSAQFVKCPSGASFLPRLFAHSIYEADPKVGACLEIAEWRGGAAHLETALFDHADCVTATGSDESLAAIRRHVPAKTRLLAYGNRVSFAFVTKESLSAASPKKIVARAASDVVAWNQLGCLSPHVIYVENGGSVPPEHFAEMLAEELADREQTEPRGELPVESAATIASRRAFYEVRAAHSLNSRVVDVPVTQRWCSENSTAWTVIYESEPRFQLSCLNRFIYVKQVNSLTEALQSADSVRGSVSTVGLEAPEETAAEIVTQLARWGVTRVCPLGRMQNPPLTWRHDGRPSLGDLITWTDWEQ
jgi:hypothetical protein